MKFLVLAAIVAVAAAGTLQPKPVAILRMASDMHDDGSFSYNFASEDGINVNAAGSQKVVGPKPENVGTVSRGSYSYTSPEGLAITVNWVADENGFQAKGDHLPVAPPMPEHVVKLLADLRAAGKL